MESTCFIVGAVSVVVMLVSVSLLLRLIAGYFSQFVRLLSISIYNKSVLPPGNILSTKNK